MVLDRARDEDDPLAQQPRIDVEAALASARLFDDDGDELRDDIEMVGHGWHVPGRLLSGLHRREGRKVQVRPFAEPGRRPGPSGLKAPSTIESSFNGPPPPANAGAE